MVVLVYNPHTRLSCQSGRYYHIQYSLLCFGPRFVMKYVYFNLGKIPKWHDRDRIVVEFATTYAVSAYHHCSCEFESRSSSAYSSCHYVIVCQWLATGRWFSPGTPISSTNKTDIAEILLKVVFFLGCLQMIHHMVIPRSYKLNYKSWSRWT